MFADVLILLVNCPITCAHSSLAVLGFQESYDLRSDAHSFWKFRKGRTNVLEAISIVKMSDKKKI